MIAVPGPWSFGCQVGLVIEKAEDREEKERASGKEKSVLKRNWLEINFDFKGKGSALSC